VGDAAAGDREVRKFVFDHFLRHSSAPALEEIAGGLRLSPAEALRSLRRLEAAHDVKLLPGTSRILMAFPFSAISTPYRVTRSQGGSYFANCAWDAIAFHPMLDEPVWIDSFCQHCARPLRFGVEGGQGHSLDGPVPIVWFGVPAADWWRDIVLTCSNAMVFFESTSHLHAWTASEKPPRGAPLTVEQVVGISVPIYSRKMRLEYVRPSREVIQARFDELGLRGPFWRL
jgi:Alkylmercury lyase